jgi:hypothetical protein
MVVVLSLVLECILTEVKLFLVTLDSLDNLLLSFLNGL